MRGKKAVMTKGANGKVTWNILPLMTKKEVYNRIVDLTSRLESTRVAEKAFDAVADADVERVNRIIAAFPEYYHELYNAIVDFGKNFNALVGDNADYRNDHNKFVEKCECYMSELIDSDIIEQIAYTEDAEQLQQIISNFKRKYRSLLEKLIKFQKEVNLKRKWMPTGTEGEIFGAEPDANHVVFDDKVLDPLSFFLLLFLANISDSYLFSAEGYENYIKALAKVTNDAFAEFVTLYVFDKCQNDGVSFGDILVPAFTGLLNE